MGSGTARGYGATLKAEGDNDDEFGFFTIVSRTPCGLPTPVWGLCHKVGISESKTCEVGLATGSNEVGCDVVQDKRHTLKSFTAYADWIKSVHFSDPAPPSRVSPRAGIPRVNQPGSYYCVSWRIKTRMSAGDDWTECRLE